MENANSTRVRQWGYSLDELLSDRAGRNVFEEFCEKQCCAENIRFWTACDNLHCTSLAQVPLEVHNIYRLVSVSVICLFIYCSTLLLRGQTTFVCFSGSTTTKMGKSGLAVQDQQYMQYTFSNCCVVVREFLADGCLSEINVSAEIKKQCAKDLITPDRYAFTTAKVSPLINDRL